MGFDHQQPQGLQQPLLADPQPTAPPLAHGAPLVGPGGAAYAVSPGPYPPYDNTHAPAVGGGHYPPVPPPAPPMSRMAAATAAAGAYAPPPVVVAATTTHIYDGGPLIQRVALAPVLQVCPSCGHTGATRVRRERGCCTWLQCFALTWLFCPLALLPCCLDCSKDLVHRCGRCGAEVARITPC